ncbi:hypothetical protein EGM51_03500 [Verrucomicrobia bacterium S94]|nr:hypothetical protein EGM51_03500 [Verrucomicrobia bacterium S94]
MILKNKGISWLVAVLLLSVSVPAQDAAKEGEVLAASENGKKVTAVYGVTADDYLIRQKAVRGKLVQNTEVTAPGSRWSFPTLFIL